MTKDTADVMPKRQSSISDEFSNQITRTRLTRRALQVNFLLARIRPAGSDLYVFDTDCLLKQNRRSGSQIHHVLVDGIGL